MKLHHEFDVDVDVETAWTTFTDLERIAPCMPGAELESNDGDAFRGSIRVRLGPISATYHGAASFELLDVSARRAVLRAEGADTRGQGNAAALITATFSARGPGTRVVIDTDLSITGKVAQFGRGVVPDVSDKLLSEFVHRVHDMLRADAGAPALTYADRDGALDLAAFVGVPAVRRRLAAAAATVLMLMIWRRCTRVRA